MRMYKLWQTGVIKLFITREEVRNHEVNSPQQHLPTQSVQRPRCKRQEQLKNVGRRRTEDFRIPLTQTLADLRAFLQSMFGSRVTLNLFQHCLVENGFLRQLYG